MKVSGSFKATAFIVSISLISPAFIGKEGGINLVVSSCKKNNPQIIKTDTSTKTHLHIFAFGQRHSVWKYKFIINGNALTLKPGHCMEYVAAGDSISFEITNKSFVKSQTPMNLYSSAKEDLFIYLTTEEPLDKFPYTTMAVKEICKECYEKLAVKCK